MARLFDDAQSECLKVGSTPITDAPFTAAGWIRVDAVDRDHIAFTLWYDSNNYHWIHISSSNDARALTEAGGASATATSSTTISVNTWHHVAGVWAATNDRRIFLDGGGKGTDTTDLTPTAADEIHLAVRDTFGYFSGRLAEFGLWNVALTDAEVAILAEGYSPLFVRPQNLVAYWPLIRDEDQDRVGNYDLTAYNTPTIATHLPQAKYPVPPIFAFGAAAAPPIGAALPVISGEAIHSLVFGGVTVR